MDVRTQEELVWWNKYSDVMAFQWDLNPVLNDILRKAWIEDFTSFLFKKDGHLLDIGCGNGWSSIHFAKLGMYVEGIDFSEEQINKSNLNLSNHPDLTGRAKFTCKNVLKITTKDFDKKFDSIFINALLHHLSSNDRKKLINNLNPLLLKGGRIYLYEPFILNNKQKTIFVRLYMAFSSIISLIFKISRKLRFQTKYFRQMKSSGYTGKSPHESSFGLGEIEVNIHPIYRIVDIIPYHCNNIVWGTFTVSLRKIPSIFFTALCPAINFLDNIFLKNRRHWHELTHFVWVLSGLKLEKK